MASTSQAASASPNLASADVLGGLVERQGTYHVGRLNHNRQTFTKSCDNGQPGLELYFWDHRDGESMAGWWLGPGIGDIVFARQPSTESKSPPAQGWLTCRAVQWCDDPSFQIRPGDPLHASTLGQSVLDAGSAASGSPASTTWAMLRAHDPAPAPEHAKLFQSQSGWPPPSGAHVTELEFATPMASRLVMIWQLYKALVFAEVYVDVAFEGTPHASHINAFGDNESHDPVPCVKTKQGVAINWWMKKNGRWRLDGKAAEVAKLMGNMRKGFSPYSGSHTHYTGKGGQQTGKKAKKNTEIRRGEGGRRHLEVPVPYGMLIGLVWPQR